MILNDFFDTYGNSISSISIPSFQTGKNIDRTEEVANQAENIAINSLIRLVQFMKEAFSFLNVLYEESDVEGYEGQFLAFKDIMKLLNLDVQSELSKLTFKDIFAPTDNTKTSCAKFCPQLSTEAYQEVDLSNTLPQRCKNVVAHFAPAAIFWASGQWNT